LSNDNTFRHGLQGNEATTETNFLATDCTDFADYRSVAQLVDAHHAQLLGYLRATGLEVGLLLNFGHSVEYKRKILDAPDAGK
jgi:GxxExxY protein